MSEPVIQAAGLSHTYRDDGVATPALRGVNLTVARGEFVCITGPSGCGKSTLLHVLGLMTRPTEAARLAIDGQEAARLGHGGRTALRRARIGFVFQRFNLIPVLSAVDNVRIALRLRGRDDRRVAAAALEQVGLAGKVTRKPRHLSMGEQQRVAIARAIACEPAVLLADEPTGNLDSRNAQGVLDLIADLHARTGLTTVMITHDLAIAERADRIARMQDGHLDA